VEPVSRLFCQKTLGKRLIVNVSHVDRVAEAVAFNGLLCLFIGLFSSEDLATFSQLVCYSG
jgi:hypothetical protein